MQISDWTGAAFQDKKYTSKFLFSIRRYLMPFSLTEQLRMIYFSLGKYQSQFGAGSQYAYYHDEDESTFHLVDTARVQKPPYQRGRFLRNQRNMRGRGGARGAQNQFQMLGKGLKSRERYVISSIISNYCKAKSVI